MNQPGLGRIRHASPAGSRRDTWHGQARIIPGDRVEPVNVGEVFGNIYNWRQIVGPGTVTAVYMIGAGIVCDVRWDRAEAGEGYGWKSLPIGQLGRIG